jgi:hypothetical protein
MKSTRIKQSTAYLDYSTFDLFIAVHTCAIIITIQAHSLHLFSAIILLNLTKISCFPETEYPHCILVSDYLILLKA